MDFKLILATIAGIMTIAAYFPYVRDMFRGTTKPHAYTWLIWAITQGTASTAIWFGQGGWGALAFIAGTACVIIVFFLSLKFGTRNITRGDTIVLILALLAIVVWWQTSNPLPAVLMASGIDTAGYIPTYRKIWSEPWSETLSFWYTMIVIIVLSIVALSSYNVLTVTYPAIMLLCNFVLVTLSLWRRRTHRAATA